MRVPTHSSASLPGRSTSRTVLVSLAALLCALALIVPLSGASAADGEAVPDTVVLVDRSARFGVLDDLDGDSGVTWFSFGSPSDVALYGDWNCDGTDSPGVFRPASAEFLLRNGSGSGSEDVRFYFGDFGDVPLVGDFDGDGCDTVGVYRPSIAKVFITNELRAGPADREFYVGDFGDQPVVGDFDGDGVDTVGVYRPSQARAFLGATGSGFMFGDPGDTMLAGDWNDDGRDTVAVYRSQSGRIYYTNMNRSGVAAGSVYVGSGLTVLPVARVDRPIGGSGDLPPDPGAGSGTPPPTAEPPASFSVVSGSLRKSGPIVTAASNVVIENLEISNPNGDCIQVKGAQNVTIRNSRIGPCGGNGIYLTDVGNVAVTGNEIRNSQRGVLVHQSNSVRVDGNSFRFTGRNFVQFDKVNGANSSISGNIGENEIGGSSAEDFISLYKSNGTSASPIRVVNNRLRSGGPSKTGSGIMAGDQGGSYQLIEGNRMVNPGQVGIGVASGTGITVRNNVVFSDAQPWSNVGIYVWNQAGTACSNITISGNAVNWYASGGRANHFWDGGNCSGVTVSNNEWGAPLGPGSF